MIDLPALEHDLRAGPPEVAALPDLIAPAADQGLLDIAYCTIDSPLGPLLLAGTSAGLLQLAYVGGDDQLDAGLRRLAGRVSPRVLLSPARLDGPRRELDEYFGGRRRAFEMPIDFQLVGPFGRRVLRAAQSIPYGQVSTYTAVAGQAGSPRAARATGNALGANPLPIVIPCHRVVRAGGGLGGYTGGLDRKRALLALESGAC